jgi:hypothetical protein
VQRLAVAGVDAEIGSGDGPRAGPVGNGKMTCVGAFTVPRDLAEALEGEGRAAWLAALPGAVRELATRWSLSIGEPFQPGGSTAWVAPVVDAVGTELVLKVVCRHTEVGGRRPGTTLCNTPTTAKAETITCRGTGVTPFDLQFLLSALATS